MGKALGHLLPAPPRALLILLSKRRRQSSWYLLQLEAGEGTWAGPRGRGTVSPAVMPAGPRAEPAACQALGDCTE